MELENMAREEFNMHIVFRVKENLFSINGQDVLSIQQLPEKLLNVPHAPDYVRGSFNNQGEIISVVDLRRFFDWTTVGQEYEEFTRMIDQRKNDHVNWVETLRSCRETGDAFTLAKDCHQCALGKWRDNYHTDAASINRLLDDLDVPHEELHALADKVLRDGEGAEETLNHISGELMPKVLEVLENMKGAFRDREFREMVVILRGEARLALTVDEVLGVEALDQQDFGCAPLMRRDRNYVHTVRQRVVGQELVMELDIPQLIADVELGAPDEA